jgi:predicted phosphodiesterase
MKLLHVRFSICCCLLLTCVSAGTFNQEFLSRNLGPFGIQLDDPASWIYANASSDVGAPTTTSSNGTCLNGQYAKNGGCVSDPLYPVPSNHCAIGDFNHSKFVRAGVTADTRVDGEEFHLMKDCGAQIYLIAGDLWYSDSKDAWFNAIEKLGFNKNNTEIARGNHDSDGKAISKWLFNNRTYGEKIGGFVDSKIAVFNVDANTKFDCFSPQYRILESQIGNSDAWYKFILVHQPFVTVKSEHEPNGQFNCYHAMFKANGVDMVLQGHNHNTQIFRIDGVEYTVGAPGTHDTGNSLYKLDDTSFDGHELLYGNDKDNGVTFLDIQIDDLSKHLIKANIVSLDNKVLYNFTN